MKAKKKMPTEVTTSLTLFRSPGQSHGEGAVAACVKGSIRRTQTLLERKAHRTSVMRTVEGEVEAVIAVAVAAAEVVGEAMEITIRVVVAMAGGVTEITTGVAVVTAGVVEAEATTVEMETVTMTIVEVVAGTILGQQGTHWLMHAASSNTNKSKRLKKCDHPSCC